ncbi:MAG: hypothetical protein ACK5W9_12120, partial [Bdellovibrionales bacterium]
KALNPRFITSPAVKTKSDKTFPRNGRMRNGMAMGASKNHDEKNSAISSPTTIWGPSFNY